MKAMKPLSRTPATPRVVETLETFDVPVNGPHSVELRKILTAQVKATKAKTPERAAAERTLAMFEENHTVVRFSRFDVQRDDRGRNIKDDNGRTKKGEMFRDEKTGKPTLDGKAAGVWVGAPELEHESSDESFANGKGLYVARLYCKSWTPRWQVPDNAPAVININASAIKAYQDLLEESEEAPEAVAEGGEAVAATGGGKTPALKPPAS